MTANSKAIQVRIEGATAARVGGQRAHDLRIGPQPDYVDSERTPLNSTIIKPLTGGEIRGICEQRRSRRETKRALKSNAVVGISGIITFGRKAQLIFAQLTRQEQDAAYLEIAKALAERLQTSLTGLVAHRDEAADHAHFQCPGVTLDGRPVSEVAKRQCLRDLQTIAAQIVSRHAVGIERGTPRWTRIEQGESYAETVHKSAAEMRHRLPADLAAARELVETEENRAQEIERRRIQLVDDLNALQADIAAAETKAAKNKELARKARIKAADDDAAAVKRLEAYERRRATAQAEADALETKQAALEKQLRKCEQDSAELTVELQKKREDLAAQEEALQVGEEILSQIQEEISSGEAKQAQIKALDAELATRTEELHQMKRLYDVKLKKQEQGTTRDFALIGSAWDLAREGEFETLVTVEDLVHEGLSPKEAAASHREMRRGLGTRPLTKGWRLYKQVLSGSGDTLLFRPSADLDAVFYELRDICRRVRSERRARLDHAQALEKAAQESREALQRTAAEMEVREASLNLREQAADLEEERLGRLKAGLEEREQAALRRGEEVRREQTALDRRKEAETEFMTAFQQSEVARVGVNDKGQMSFWRSDALPEERKAALLAAWRQIGPELRSMLQNLSERRRELGVREEALKSQEQAATREKERLDRRREWRVRLVLGVRRRRTEIMAREAAVELQETTAQRWERHMRRELETAQAAFDQQREAETAFMTAFQSGEVSRVGVNDKGMMNFWRSDDLPEERKAALLAAWRRVGPELRSMMQNISELRRELGTREEALNGREKTSVLEMARLDHKREHLLRAALRVRGRRRENVGREATVKVLESSVAEREAKLERERADLDQRRAGEMEFLTAFQSGDVARVGVDEQGQTTFWRLTALPAEKKQALNTAWPQVGPELRSMLQTLSERRRELEVREEALKSQEQASALEEERLDRRQEWRVRLTLGVRRRRTEITAREAAVTLQEATAQRWEKRMRRELETRKAAFDQQREAETAFMTAFQSGEVARVGLNDKGRLTFWFAQTLPEDRKAPLRAAWGQVSPEFQTLLQAVGEERRKALEQGRETGTEEIKAAVAAGVEALHRGEITEVRREDETWSLRYHPGLQEERRGLLARILEPVLKIVAPILRRITDFLKGQDLQVKAYAEAVRRPSIDWSSGPSM